MNLSDKMEEIRLLNQFSLKSKTYGLKIHEQEASSDSINAAARLFHKGLTDHLDGGYLTDLGIVAAGHAQTLLKILED